MTPIQIILTLSVLLIATIGWLKLKRKFVFKLLLTITTFISVGLVWFPDLSTVLANWLGVGRGTDLLVYLGFINVTFFYFILYIRFRKLREDFTIIVRELAILKKEKESQPH